MPTNTESDVEDLTPNSREEHQRLLNWCLSAFQAAEEARKPFDDRWMRYYKLYRSFRKRKQGDWRSHVFIPVSFWVVETVTPRMVAELPKPVVLPIGPEDVEPAKVIEELLWWSFQNSGIYLELVKAIKSGLKYGTGIVKTFHDRKERMTRVRQPVMQPVFLDQPVIDPETGQPMLDINGQPISQQIEAGEEPQLDEDGQPIVESQRIPYVAYDGPRGEWVDIFNFWPPPEATQIDDARYVIHRVYRDWKHIKKLVEQGVYKLPDGIDEKDIISPDDPASDRLESIELGSKRDSTRPAVELLEFWTDDRVITLANKKAIIRVAENPFDHGEKPFIRIVDHLVEGEFWGIGEIEVLEGLQDFMNATVNQRIDNLRLILNAMFAVDVSKLEDPRDLQMRPGGVIRLKGADALPQEVLHRIDMGDVTASAYQEVAEAERIIEKVSAVSAYQTGSDSPDLNKTATGVALIQEQGASRFSLKTRIAELTGLTALARHFGSILQQFWPEERMVRFAGEKGAFTWQSFTPDGLQGAVDYDIESDSTTQTESVRKDQALNLLQMLGSFPGVNINALVEDVLKEFGKKDLDKYLAPPAAELTAGAAPLPGEELPPGGEIPPEDMLAALEQQA